jgi:heme/copper-type cytochrome/quinol oxidase subunit 1
MEGVMKIKQKTFLQYFPLLVKIKRDDNLANHLKTIFGIRFTPAVLFAIGFVVILIIGVLKGSFLANSTLVIHLHDTYFVIAHMPLVIGAAALFSIFCALYYWFPKVFGKFMNSTLAYIHFWVSLAGICLFFWPVQYSGLAGMPRRYVDYSGWQAFVRFGVPNQAMINIALIVFAAQLLFVFNFFYSIFNGRKATDENRHGERSPERRTDYHGSLKGNKFSLWRYMKLTGIFYPVFYGEINLDNLEQDLIIRSRLNPVGRYFLLIFFGLIVYGLVSDHSDDFPDWIGRISLSGLFIWASYFLIALLLLRQINRYNQKKALADLEEKLKYYESRGDA